jgi:hypothetical protein
VALDRYFGVPEFAGAKISSRYAMGISCVIREKRQHVLDGFKK